MIDHHRGCGKGIDWLQGLLQRDMPIEWQILPRNVISRAVDVAIVSLHFSAGTTASTALSQEPRGLRGPSLSWSEIVR